MAREGDSQTLMYSFFEKPTASPYVTMENSAWSWANKHSSLAQDMVRRMSNMTEKLDQDTRDRVVDQFSDKLRTSGYNTIQIKQIIISGLKGYERRRRREMEGGTPIHRMKYTMQKGRDLRKLVEKKNWYRRKADPYSTQESGAGGGGRGTGQPHTQDTETTPAAVMFVPRTPEGELISQLRRVESKLREVTNKPLRLVEEAGVKMLEVLCKGDPWDAVHCQRENCTTCRPDWGKVGTCRVKNVVYEDICLTCKDNNKSSRYIGESHRTMFQRGLEHVADVSNLGKISHIRDHIQAEHPELIHRLLEAPNTLFSMQLIKPARTALSRQIREAVEISANTTGGAVLNSKEEFSRCLIPVLQVEGPRKNKTPDTRPAQSAQEEQEEEMLAFTKSKKRTHMNKTKPAKRARQDVQHQAAQGAEGEHQHEGQQEPGGGGVEAQHDAHGVQQEVPNKEVPGVVQQGDQREAQEVPSQDVQGDQQRVQQGAHEVPCDEVQHEGRRRKEHLLKTHIQQEHEQNKHIHIQTEQVEKSEEQDKMRSTLSEQQENIVNRSVGLSITTDRQEPITSLDEPVSIVKVPGQKIIRKGSVMSNRKGSQKNRLKKGALNSDIRRFFISTNNKQCSADIYTYDEERSCDEPSTGLVKYPTHIDRGPFSFSLETAENYLDLEGDMLKEITSSYWTLFKGGGASIFTYS